MNSNMDIIKSINHPQTFENHEEVNEEEIYIDVTEDIFSTTHVHI